MLFKFLLISLYVCSDVLGNIYEDLRNVTIVYIDQELNTIFGKIVIKANTTVTYRCPPEIENGTFFTLYTRENPEGVVTETESQIRMSSFDKRKKTKFVTHGWLSKGISNESQLIKDQYLQEYDVNVFIFDWSKIAHLVFYPYVAMCTPIIAKPYTNLLNILIENVGVNPQDMHLIGHSLGAHVSGFAARGASKGKIGRVTGLDPAFPNFEVFVTVPEGHLNSMDAEFVDVIHTCKGFYGMIEAVGHVDFYPNGGSSLQPGCDLLVTPLECSHGSSWKYFVRSINVKNQFLSYQCQSFEELESKNNCKGNVTLMGDPVPTTARGIYYLETDASSQDIN